MHFSFKSPVQNSSLATSVTVLSWHQNEPRPAMSLSAQTGGGADGGGLGGGGADGGCPSHKRQVFLHFLFFSSVYLLHFLFLQVSLSASAHSGGLLGSGGGGSGDCDGGGREGGGGAGGEDGGLGE